MRMRPRDPIIRSHGTLPGFVLPVVFVVFFILLPFPAVSQSKGMLDLKTPWAQKVELFPIQVGTTWRLLNDDFGVFEVGEDYAVWFHDYARTRNDGTFRVSFRIDLTAPAAFSKPPVLQSRSVEFQYHVDELEAVDVDESLLRFLKQRVSFLNQQITYEANKGGELAAAAIKALIEEQRLQEKDLFPDEPMDRTIQSSPVRRESTAYS